MDVADLIALERSMRDLRNWGMPGASAEADQIHREYVEGCLRRGVCITLYCWSAADQCGWCKTHCQHPSGSRSCRPPCEAAQWWPERLRCDGPQDAVIVETRFKDRYSSCVQHARRLLRSYGSHEYRVHPGTLPGAAGQVYRDVGMTAPNLSVRCESAYIEFETACDGPVDAVTIEDHSAPGGDINTGCVLHAALLAARWTYTRVNSKSVSGAAFEVCSRAGISPGRSIPEWGDDDYY